MSWESLNPKIYDSICEDGIVEELCFQLGQLDVELFDDPLTVLELAVTILYSNPKIAPALREWAHTRIQAAEAQYHRNLKGEE